jgi:hypothetical protein
MSKEKVFIVVSHKHSVKKGKTGSPDDTPEWEVGEKVEFVNQLRERHLTSASAIGDYLNKKMIVGERNGMGEYNKFDSYVRSKYPQQMAELDAAYAAQVVDLTPPEPEAETISDEFGNVRARTVFDPV